MNTFLQYKCIICWIFHICSRNLIILTLSTQLLHLPSMQQHVLGDEKLESSLAEIVLVDTKLNISDKES